jgi:mannose-1-phosphate guanylyltransferase
LHSVLPADEKGIIRVMGQSLDLDTKRTVICETGDRIVVTIGVEDLIVVDDGNVVLVCARDRAQDVKSAVEKLQQDGHHQYL